MTTRADLQRELGRLSADEVDTAIPVPEALWTRGRRWQRRRLGRAIVTVACVAAFTAGLAGAVLPFVPGVPGTSDAASSGIAPRIPDRVHAPPLWAASVSGTALVAVTEAERGTWVGREPALAVITAAGAYGYLDLPDRSEGFALSPDGERLAYWTAGTPSGDPQTNDAQSKVTTGLAVRTLRTGVEQRHEVPTVHGLDPGSLAWLDDTTVVFEYGQNIVGDSAPSAEQGGSNEHGGWWWRLAADEPEPWPWGDEDVVDPLFWGVNEGAAIGTSSGEALTLVDPGVRLREGLAARASGGGASHMAPTVAWGGDGQVALLGEEGGSETPAQVRTGRLAVEGGDARLVDLTLIPGGEVANGLLGWRDGDLLVVVLGDDPHIATVDVETGNRRVLVSWDVDEHDRGAAWRFARGVLETGEVVPATAPRDPDDPRAVGGVLSVGLVGVLGWSALRRRRDRP
ncbi:hypothetical protein [Nocardioides jishulii]|uniref:WD40 repeat domain-containing protein n=1 Tax=Nocardioides jishulii TaxID=2575440 RepID=A0A4U2YLR3_9ACTN|nr:hypothetical protein [Nocardioides jishulii]QCX27267.1 hypothetical protein FCL41_06820 [Nocardioides jishulii]TKI61754.1 hypothetical protein FC770_13460 [Nocardioides jishulii]